jgi:hypothetical protein
MSAQAKRLTATVVIALVVCVAIGLFVGLYLLKVPGSVAATSTASGSQLYVATVATAEPSDPHPTWVSYYAVNASSGDWRHDTTFVVPANTLVHMTIYQYDTATGLRNPFLAQPSGTVGSVTIDGKATRCSTRARRGTPSRSPRSACRSRSRGRRATPRICARRHLAR